MILASTIFLIIAQASTVQMITSSSAITLFQNSVFNPEFSQDSQTFNCSTNDLYTYLQTQQQYDSNSPYFIQLSNFGEEVNISIDSSYYILKPALNQTKCQVFPCTLSITNGCPQKVGYFNYFDILHLKITGVGLLSYNVICIDTFTKNTFQWGLLLLIIFCSVIIFLLALYSSAWSLGGFGIAINIYMAIGFVIILIIGGTIGYLAPQVLNVGLKVLIFILGMYREMEVPQAQLYAVTNCFSWLKAHFSKKLFSLFEFNLLVGLGVSIGVLFSNKNWIVNDLVSISMIVAGIKILKFTSLKMAFIFFCLSMTVQMVFVVTIHYVSEQSYNNLILNEFNCPIQLQAPTINAVYDQKCAWLPINAIIYPGIIMSYLRRFDSSRNTHVYLVTTIVLFVLGSFLWMIISVVNPHSWPLGIVAEPLMLIAVILFAYKRVQLRTIWEGKFYDEEFADKESLERIKEAIQMERRDSQLTFKSQYVNGLRMADYNSYSSQKQA